MRCLLCVALLFTGCIALAGDEPIKAAAGTEKKKEAVQDTKPVSFWMEKKLEYTQEIIRGLATGDLPEVAKRAEQMRLLSRVEGWVRKGRPGYRAHFQAFEFANAEILRNARANNLDGAAIGFQQLTITCVSCHKMLRDVD